MTDRQALRKAKLEMFSWVNNQKLKTGPKAVLKALAEFADQSGSTFRGQEAIAERVGCSERTVRRCLDQLENPSEAGEPLVRRTHRYDAKGRRTSDTITLLWRPSLPAILAGSEIAGTTGGKSVHDYRPNCTSLPAKIAASIGTTVESINESYPPTHRGAQGRDFGSRIEASDGRRMRLHAGSTEFDRWVAYWRSVGRADLVQEAISQGWLAAPSKWPPVSESQGKRAIG